MLSRLISLLRRIPAVKWAFTKLRPLPHGGSIDTGQIAAGDSPAIVADITIVTPVAEDGTAISLVAEIPSAAPIQFSVSGDSSVETPTEVERVVAEKLSVTPVEATEPTSNDPPVELSTCVAPVVAEEAPVSLIDLEHAVDDAPVVTVNDDLSSDVVVDVEPIVVDHSRVAHAGSEVSPIGHGADSVDGSPSPLVAAEIEPVPANDLAPVAATTENSSADTPDVITNIVPEPVLESSAPEIRSAPKARARTAEPADRAALIRQRWAETGIRMWNPRLHGAGDATLNIQGSVGLLPPAPGETMPRYDKLEFRMLGGQIVCEGVIVEAPAQASHRSFTHLAEPAKLERAREPIRERQAALA